jgi:hypothetical protein
MATFTTQDKGKVKVKGKIKKNYSSDIFTEAERYEIYHKIVDYSSVKRFLEKRSRGSERTSIVYHTALTYLEKYL